MHVGVNGILRSRKAEVVTEELKDQSSSEETIGWEPFFDFSIREGIMTIEAEHFCDFIPVGAQEQIVRFVPFWSPSLS